MKINRLRPVFASHAFSAGLKFPIGTGVSGPEVYILFQETDVNVRRERLDPKEISHDRIQ
jgi:hypothetical protein